MTSRATAVSYTVERATRASRIGGVLALILVAFLATFPFWADHGWMREFNEMACYLIFAMMWNLQGGYVAIGTWVIAEVFRLSIANVSAVGGGSGTSLTALRGIEKATRVSLTFWLCLIGAVTSVALVYAFLRSRHGLALLAIRDSEIASESQGVNVRATKLGVYLVSAFGAGLAGALFFLGNLRISPDAAFTVNWTAFSIFIVLIGGIGTIEGPIVGVILFYLLSKFFSDYGTWYLVGLGLLAIVVTIRFPRGLWGWISSKYDLHFFPVQRRLVLPPDMRTDQHGN